MKRFIGILFFLIPTMVVSQTTEVTDYFEGEVIVKIKPQYARKCAKTFIDIPSIEKIRQEEKIERIEKVFPNHLSPDKKKGQENHVDLSTIYSFQFDATLDEKKVIHQLRKNPVVAYAELNYKNELAYTPNDSIHSEQWYLAAVKLYQAWDIEQGDTSVVVGIVDTGSDLDHEDLISDFAYNYNDPINGIDDDNDGYIDNFNGWDIANNDNSPGISNSGHGTNVAGIASASTDNIKGVSGAGFNTRILTVKIDDETTGSLTGAYQGIVYAADHGAFIINNSWGSLQYSSFGQDIVNYAALNKKCMVIAATGNNGRETRFYPAAYDNVFSVGSMTNPDTVKANSNYGYWVDIFAPGEHMTTCNAIGGYQTNGGTSMASPLVAGIASLVKSQFPHYTWEQVAEHIRNTGDNIYALNDPKYAGRLGGGRINAYQAVLPSSLPGIRFQNRNLTDNNDDIFAIGDTIRVSGTFRNFLNDAQNVSVSISTIGNKLQVLTPTLSLGNINELDSVSIRNTPFELLVGSGIDYNETIEVQITITADNYQKKEYFELTANVNYITLSENNLTLSISSDGGIGYGGDESDLGAGIQHLGSFSHLYEGGLLIGNSESFIVNKFRGENFDIDLDFQTTTPVKKINNDLADVTTSSEYTDEKSASPPRLKIINNNYLFNNTEAQNSIIYEYEIENISSANMIDLYLGMALDWDIVNYENNIIRYDAARKMGITSSTDSAVFCGVRVLTDSLESNHFGIDNVGNSQINGGLNPTDGFSDLEKFQVLSISRDNAGNADSSGNDVIDVNSIGPFDLAVGEKKTLAFSITISGSMSLLEEESDTLMALYQRLPDNDVPTETPPNFEGFSISPNPAKDLINFQFNMTESQPITLSIYDLRGALVYREKKEYSGNLIESISISLEGWKTGAYFVEVKGNNGNLVVEKFIVAQ